MCCLQFVVRSLWGYIYIYVVWYLLCLLAGVFVVVAVVVGFFGLSVAVASGVSLKHLLKFCRGV